MNHITNQSDSTPRKQRAVKCAECPYPIDRETQQHVTESKKNYHQECYDAFQIRKQHRIELLEYICELYKIPVVNGFMLKQIKEFQDDYNYTLKGIQMTLQYFHVVNGNPINPTNGKYNTTKGIGIVPYVYDEARDYFIKMQKIAQSAQNMKVDTTSDVDVVYVKRPTKKKPKNFIEIKGLANE